VLVVSREKFVYYVVHQNDKEHIDMAVFMYMIVFTWGASIAASDTAATTAMPCVAPTIVAQSWCTIASM
jgi:hypothetical protein